MSKTGAPYKLNKKGQKHRQSAVAGRQQLYCATTNNNIHAHISCVVIQYCIPYYCHFRDCESAASHKSDSCKWHYSKCPDL